MMKRSLNITGVMLALALCLAMLAACRQEKETMSFPIPDNTGNTRQTVRHKPDRGDLTSVKESAIFREDEEGLVQIHIENGQARICFDLERWQEVHEIDDPAHAICPAEDLRKGPFLIQTQQGNVADACIGKVEGVSLSIYGFTTPSIVLLMEDGSLEWLSADPYMTQNTGVLDENYIVFKSLPLYERLPGAKGFSSLICEADVDGTGEMAIYATDATGSRFDFRMLWLEGQLFHGIWVCELVPAQFDRDTSVCGYLRLEKDGAHFDVGEGAKYYPTPDQYFESWEGTVELVKTAGDGSSPYSIAFDLKLNLALNWWIWEGDGSLCEQTSGIYRAEFWPEGCLTLSPKGGDLLYPVEAALETLYFYQYWDEGRSDNGVEAPARSTLAYVKFDEYLDYGFIRLLVDEVLWIDDEYEPNDYRIVNETEEWIPYVADSWTECSLWYFVNDAAGDGYGMERKFLDIDDFVIELKDGYRENTVLAWVTIAEEFIEAIEEQYTP